MTKNIFPNPNEEFPVDGIDSVTYIKPTIKNKNIIVGSNIPPYTIVAGNPATTIRKRFDDDFIEFLEQLKWWDLDISKINEIIPALNDKDLSNVKETLKKYLK